MKVNGDAGRTPAFRRGEEVELLTVGHGRADRSRLTELLTGAGVEFVVDVRRYPASRANPDVRREELARWLPAAGIGYRWEPRLGGRRRIPAGEPEPDTWWTVPAFRAYAAYTRTPDFRAALDQLMAEAATRTTTVMCSESVWWRCHRRLVADVATLARGATVRHLMPDGRLAPHRLSAGARLLPDGDVIWAG